MSRVTTIAEDTTPTAVETQWLGTWVGVYRGSKRTVAVWLHLVSDDEGVKATLDLLPREFGLAANDVKTTPDGFAVQVPHPGGDIRLALQKRGSAISATGTVGGKTVPLLLTERAEPDLKTFLRGRVSERTARVPLRTSGCRLHYHCRTAFR